MTLKPLQSIDEHDVINFFALNTATGSRGTPVIILSGWNNSQNLNISNTQLVGNSNFYSANIVTPRWEVPARVRACVSGEKPFGIQLYDVLEVNQWGYPLIYDKQRREELQAVLSGMPVPIARKGLMLVGPFTTGSGFITPAAGTFAIVGAGTGQWAAIAGVSGEKPAGINAFGQYLGGLDAQGFAAVSVSCYL